MGILINRKLMAINLLTGHHVVLNDEIVCTRQRRCQPVVQPLTHVPIHIPHLSVDHLITNRIIISKLTGYSSSQHASPLREHPMPFGIARCYLPSGTGGIPAFTPVLELVLDLATQHGCKAELS